jgi:Cu/Ag efflux protein CusF
MPRNLLAVSPVAAIDHPANGVVCRYRPACAVLLVAAFLCACNLSEEAPAPVKRFPLGGEVTLLIPALQRVVIRHDAVEDWSAAATNMEYPVNDPAEMAKLSLGDRIRGVVFVQGPQYWLGEIEVISPRPDIRE